MEALAFMLCVQPRKVIWHPHALKEGWWSVEALLGMADAVDFELGPPVPGSFRQSFRWDWRPRQRPVHQFQGKFPWRQEETDA